ncbi:hypothetical protein NUW54_g8850 [Trametes sanguinea]|uniref:Uncharacterized protein n=1 Tax=Trametes sanguinea TaxID=158606 RepID=A0ACC1PC11_9APHY|nr:hypothetical protein NUW54_g8850 [Trametes sanguinea]
MTTSAPSTGWLRSNPRVSTLFSVLMAVGVASTAYGVYQFYSTFTMWPPEVRGDLRAGIKAKHQGDHDLSARYLQRAWGHRADAPRQEAQKVHADTRQKTPQAERSGRARARPRQCSAAAGRGRTSAGRRCRLLSTAYSNAGDGLSAAEQREQQHYHRRLQQARAELISKRHRWPRSARGRRTVVEDFLQGIGLSADLASMLRGVGVSDRARMRALGGLPDAELDKLDRCLARAGLDDAARILVRCGLRKCAAA